MITITKNDGHLLDTISDFEIGSWVHLAYPTKEEIERVATATNIPLELFEVALDPEESAHTDSEDGSNLVVMDIPIIDKEAGVSVFSTCPIGMIYNKDYFVTVCLKESSIVKDFWSNRVKNVDVTKKVRFMLQFVSRIEYKYLQYLKRIDKMSLAIQKELEKSVKNKELIELLDIEKSLVYFSTSLTANDRVLYRIMRSEDFKKYDEDKDLLEDVITENRQAIEMCSIYRDILSGTMDAYASVISNNLNIIMKLLAIFTIVMTVPTIISGLWGMNVLVPFAETQPKFLGFAIVIGIAAILTVIVTIILVKLTSSTRGGRRKK